MAVGLTLIFGVMGIVNFAHGELFMLGAYFYYLLCSAYGLPPSLSLLISPLIVLVFGLVVERGAIHLILQGKNWDMNTLLFTFGLSLFLQNFALVVWGPEFMGAPKVLEGTTIILGEIAYGNQRLLAIGLSSVLIILLHFILKETRYGKAIRAVAQDPVMSELVGVNNAVIFMITFGIGAGLAALAGAIAGPLFFISPTMGVTPSLMAFVVVIFGGLGSFYGSIIASFILGITESLAAAYISSQYKDAFAFAIMIAMMALRPSGLFGRRRAS
jgi:branched-chain amino acid transport system permease protein